MDPSCFKWSRTKRCPSRRLIVATGLLGLCLLVVQRLRSLDLYHESDTSDTLPLSLRQLALSSMYHVNRSQRVPTARDSLPKRRTGSEIEWGSVQLSSSGLVNVIEEHHEVLLYWFSAAETGSLPKQGNTLLHIDGHSDAGASTSWLNMPLYRLPSNQRELRLMMENNDEFIQVAAATGLINRFVWVWPHYDIGWDDGDARNTSHVTIHVTAWVTYRTGRDEEEEEEYVLERCACAESNHSFLEDGCFWIEDGDYSPLDKSLCLDRNVHGTLELVSTWKAIELAQAGQLVKSSENFILDIDEDFYACESASVGLYDSGLESEDISNISFFIGNILCVDNAVDELSANMYFTELISIILNIRTSCENESVVTDLMCTSSLKQVSGVVEKSLHLIDEFHDVMCLPRESTLYMLRKLVYRLVLRTNEQLHELSSVGVCMREAPRGTNFHKTGGMVLCKGYNDPNSTWVTTHTLAPEELEKTTINLEDILRGSNPPKLVTLVRSTRDGYTPRYVAQDIKRNILAVLKRVYPDHVTDESIYYDEQLLGGPEGWYSRHRK